MSKKISNKQFAEWVAKAKTGEVHALNQYLKELYQDGKRSLVRLTGSEPEAEEYFADAVAKFWGKFVTGNESLPETNISGYIYTMAKFKCLDHKRRKTNSQVIIPIEPGVANRKELAEDPAIESDLKEVAEREEQRRKAMQRAIKQLGENCQRLFRMVLETGVEKPRELFGKLGLKDARAVTVLRYECTKQLKVKAAIELELLMQEGH